MWYYRVMTPDRKRLFYNEQGELITFDAFSPADKKFLKIIGGILAGAAVVSFAPPPGLEKICQLPINEHWRAVCNETPEKRIVRETLVRHLLAPWMADSLHKPLPSFWDQVGPVAELSCKGVISLVVAATVARLGIPRAISTHRQYQTNEAKRIADNARVRQHTQKMNTALQKKYGESRDNRVARQSRYYRTGSPKGVEIKVSKK